MFGYVIVNRAELTKEEERRYRAFYCGLCRTLKDCYGTSGRLTLTYDMTFLVILLTSLYEPSLSETSERCVVHPLEKHEMFLSPISEYAARMNVALAYQKCLDDWRDERRLAARSEARMLRKHYADIAREYPRQCEAIERGMRELRELEMCGSNDLDACANCFGEMIAEVFVFREDEWAEELRGMGRALGRFLYLLDAYDDLAADSKKGLFNPLIALSEQENFTENIKQILVMLMGECTLHFERLPLVEDIEILRNILYSGVWAKYEAVNKTKRADAKGKTK